MKKLLIIGAGVYQIPLIEYAVTVCKVIVAAPEISDYLKSLIYKYIICDVNDREKILKFAQEEEIDGVITDQTDIAVRTVAYVAEKLSLPGIGYDTACLFTDKNLMRKKMEHLGIKVLPYIVTSSLADACEFYKYNKNSPIILKPTDNQGSRGVAVCNSLDEIKARFNEAISYSKTKQVVIEKFVMGREFVVESLCFDNNYVPLIWGDSHYFNIENMFAPYERIFPSSAEERIVQKLLSLNKQIITGFGLKQGIAHSEYIMDGDDIYLIETAARGGGVFISSDLISLGTSINTEEFLVNIALGNQKAFPKVEYSKNAYGYMAFVLPKGTVISLDGIDYVKALPYVHRHLLDSIFVGKRVHVTCDKTSRYAIIVSADNLGQLNQRMDDIRDKLRIKVECDGKQQQIIFQ